MKKTSYLFLLITIIFFSCERDDICAEGTPTTPRLLIEFFDILDNEELKTVPRLSVYAEVLVTDENGLFTPPEVASDTTLIFNENSNAIALPLLVSEENVENTIRYFLEKDTNLRLDDNTTTTSDIDILEITYTPQFEYVSRACGFKSIFTNVQVELFAGDDGTQWAQNEILTESIFENAIIENEDNTHVQISH